MSSLSSHHCTTATVNTGTQSWGRLVLQLVTNIVTLAAAVTDIFHWQTRRTSRRCGQAMASHIPDTIRPPSDVRGLDPIESLGREDSQHFEVERDGR